MKIPKQDLKHLAAGTLEAVREYFKNPKVQADFAEWLKSRKEDKS